MAALEGSIQLLGKTAAQWASDNTVLLAKQVGIVTDQDNRFKVGDGVTAWNSLPYHNYRFDGTLLKSDNGDSALMLGDGVELQYSDANAAATVTARAADATSYYEDFITGDWGQLKIETTKAEIQHTQLINLQAPSVTVNGQALGNAATKNIGTTAGTVAEGNDYRFGSQAAISGTDIDWNTATHFYKTLSANTTFTFSNLADAKTIQVAITNTASNYTVTWPTTVDWGSAGAPTQRTGAVTDIYTFTRINGTVYGAVRQ